MDKKDCDRGCGGSSGFDSFVDSIEEEIRSEKWLAIWNRYGKIVSYAVGILLVSVGVYNMWLRQDLAEREAVSQKFSMVQNLLSSGNAEQVLPQLRELSASSREPYKTLAKLVYASILRSKNDRMAISQYRQIAEDSKVDSTFREFAYIMYVGASLDLLSAKEISQELDGFIATLSEKKYLDCSWGMLALETLAFCYVKYGKNDLAKETLIRLAKITGVPQDMADRAKTLVSLLDL
ncbi:MAG: tetratricopeptide repeat protein, partial [Holosporales bacterium]|nr:tetratricopeptide repeat protein [Holosporales bacterium]